MDEPPAIDAAPAKKRGWFQIHLSTAVALMVAAGTLLGANLLNYENSDYRSVGWPYEFYAHYIDINRVVSNRFDGFSWVVFDGIVAVLVLVLIGFIFEARAWGWPRGKIFLWAFVGAAVSLQMIANLHYLIAAAFPH